MAHQGSQQETEAQQADPQLQATGQAHPPSPDALEQGVNRGRHAQGWEGHCWEAHGWEGGNSASNWARCTTALT